MAETPEKERERTPALLLSDEELSAEAEISEVDKRRAAAFWRAHAPDAMKNLLDAKEGTV